MKKGKNKFLTGFTIIELLVVIAIIAVLAAIVIVNVTQYINKGKDAAAKGNLSTALANSAIFFDSIASPTGTYNLFVTGAGAGNATYYVPIYTALTGAGFVVADIASSCDTDACAATATKWCMSVKLKGPAISGAYYCVDSSGAKKESITAMCASGACPN